MEGCAGLRSGLGVVHGILDQFWEHAFPEEEEDRAYALDFLNAKAAPLLAFDEVQFYILRGKQTWSGNLPVSWLR